MSAGTIILTFLLITYAATAQNLAVKWEELTAGDFTKAIEQSRGTCVLPFGILEKHGPHLPLGTDLINARYLALNGAQQEYAVVFPEYYFGQISKRSMNPARSHTVRGCNWSYCRRRRMKWLGTVARRY